MKKIKINFMYILLILTLATSLCSALYEDQIGKFDW